MNISLFHGLEGESIYFKALTTNDAEIGYVFHKDHWGKGYGTETVALLNDFAFKSLNLHKL